MNPEEEAQQAQPESDPFEVPDGHVLVPVGDLPENFKSEQALVESFRESQRKITELGQTASQARREAEQERQARTELEQLYAEQQRTQQPRQEDNYLLDAAQRALDEGDARALLAIQAEVGRLSAQQQQEQFTASQPPQDLDQLAFLAEQRVRSKHGEVYDELKPQVAELLAQDPSRFFGDDDKPMSLAEVERGIETALAFAQRDHLVKEHTSLAQQQSEQELARQRKLQAQTTTGSGPGRVAPPDEAQQEWERIKAATTERFSTM